MKNISVLLIVLLIHNIQVGFSQEVKKNNGLIDAYNFTPKENIFVHYNTSLLFSGEYLYYKVYCINATINHLSNLSKVAYVELVNEKKQRIFRHKITLKNGLGQGDFFISTTIPSGNYKLIAYTQWMKNGGKYYFFKDDISIINPYMANQIAIMDTANISTKYLSENYIKTNTSNYLELTTNSKIFEKRTKVSLIVKNLKETAGFGNFSLSVRKIDTINQPLKLNATNYKKKYSKNINPKYQGDSEIYYPEINGGIISGKIVDKLTKLPAQDQNVSLSISGENFIFKTATTDKNGIFNLSLKENHDKETGVIQVLGDDRDNFSVEITEIPSVDLSQLNFNSFKITSSIKEMILKRSIYNQIENGYYVAKPDTIISIPLQKPFYSGYNSTAFFLDDYAKFSTVKEIFIEIVENVWTTKNENGERVFYVRNNIDNNKNYLPLIFIDGVLIQDHNHLLEYKANKIKKIEILRGEAHLGTAVYQGVIIVETLDGDYNNLSKGVFIQEITLFKPQQSKKYFHQTYVSNNKVSYHIPDYRNQLLWEPVVSLNSNEFELIFYTSDNTGNYEICLEGFTKQGIPVTLRKVITVN